MQKMTWLTLLLIFSITTGGCTVPTGLRNATPLWKPVTDQPVSDSSEADSKARSRPAPKPHEKKTGEPEVGFLHGSKALFKELPDPQGNPIYFESPVIDSQIKLIYLWHEFPKKTLGGGDLNVLAAQVRVALTEWMAIIATKDGYSWLDANGLPEDSGWNDFAAGLKFRLFEDEAAKTIVSAGFRWETHNGAAEVLQGTSSDDDEISPFISAGKSWDRLHAIAHLGGRIPLDSDRGNHQMVLDLQFSYELLPDSLPGLMPTLSFHAIQYLSNGKGLPVNFGGIDYTNLGTTKVSGKLTAWGDVGLRWNMSQRFSAGVSYGYPISQPNRDIFEQRVTLDFLVKF